MSFTTREVLSTMTTIRYDNSPLQFSNDIERTITLEEVSYHDTVCDCWIVIYDRVYDVTDFQDKHPGGSEIFLEYAGRDASCAFRGAGHSKIALKSLERFLIGELPMEERMFRKFGGYHLSDLPE